MFLPEGPDFFRFGNSNYAKETMESVGFENVESVELSGMKWTYVVTQWAHAIRCAISWDSQDKGTSEETNAQRIFCNPVLGCREI